MYKKRLHKLPGDVLGGGSGEHVAGETSAIVPTEDVVDGMNYGLEDYADVKGVDRLVSELESRDKARKSFHRRRYEFLTQCAR